MTAISAVRLMGLAAPCILMLSGCASVPLQDGGTLTSYSKLGDTKGNLSKARIFVDGQGLASVKRVSIVPTRFTSRAASKIESPADRALVSNVLDRALCIALSDKYEIVPTSQHADLIIRSAVTDVVPTDKAMAGAATAITLGSSAFLPVAAPRLPIGLGGLAVEAEAVDNKGVQRAAVIWARGANSIQNSPLVSEVGDAYALASTFAIDFSRTLILGKEPEMLDISLPSGQWIQSWFGGEPKYAACEAFGRAPGLSGIVAAKFGAPPEWTDKPPNASPQ